MVVENEWVGIWGYERIGERGENGCMGLDERVNDIDDGWNMSMYVLSVRKGICEY